jgi:hypothetical protein
MAAEIVQGLFGVSPQSMKAQLDAQNQAQQMQLASLSPEQQRFMMMGQGGRAAGQALGGLFGAQDPMMDANNKSNDVVSQALSKLTPEQQQDPIAMHTAVYEAAMQAGDTELASRSYGQLQQAKTTAASQSKDIAQANKINEELANNKQLRIELSKVSPNATDEEMLNIYYKWANPDVAVKALETKNNLASARDAKLTSDTENRTLAREKLKADNDTRIEVARQQGATQTAISNMSNGMKIQLAEYDRKTQFDIATIKATNASLKAGHPKDVAEASSSIAGSNLINEETDKFINQITKGEVRFGFGTNIAGKTSTALGMSTDNALMQNNIKRHINEGVNNMLLLAAGTQNDGDAKRAKELFITANSDNDAKSWSAALEALKKTTNKIIIEKKAYMNERGFPFKESTDGWSIVEKK